MKNEVEQKNMKELKELGRQIIKIEKTEIKFLLFFIPVGFIVFLTKNPWIQLTTIITEIIMLILYLKLSKRKEKIAKKYMDLLNKEFERMKNEII